MRCQICDHDSGMADRRFGLVSGMQSGRDVRSVGDLPETAGTAVMKCHSLEIALMLTDVCAVDGGFIMDAATPLADAKPENVPTMHDFAGE
ncbi:MAG: hypothetical protein ACLP5H_29395 [Desulfomonilaceae bacterium]